MSPMHFFPYTSFGFLEQNPIFRLWMYWLLGVVLWRADEYSWLFGVLPELCSYKIKSQNSSPVSEPCGTNNSQFESLVDHLIAGTCVSFWKKGPWLDERILWALVIRFIKSWDEITTKFQRKCRKSLGPGGWVISVWINACFVGFLQHLRWENDG